MQSPLRPSDQPLQVTCRRPLQTGHSCPNLLPNISRPLTTLTAPSGPGSPGETGKIWGPRIMFSEELWLENEKKCAVARKPKQGRKRQELLAVALGVKVGITGFLWPPLKLFACPQISSLVRRAALTQSDTHFNYEKTHNFKVSKPLVLSPVIKGQVDKGSLWFPSGLGL